VRRRLHQISDVGRRPDVARAIDAAFACDVTMPIGPTMRSDEIAELETEHGIALPYEYRRFVAEVANGGLGPFHGMLTMQEGLERAGAPAENFRPGERVGRVPGALPLCDYGCGMEAVLVLNGDAVGEIWMDDPNADRVDPWWRYSMLHGPIDDIGTERSASAERPYRFLDWFAEWATTVGSAMARD
jgi:hypothetical protein